MPNGKTMPQYWGSRSVDTVCRDDARLPKINNSSGPTQVPVAQKGKKSVKPGETAKFLREKTTERHYDKWG